MVTPLESNPIRCATMLCHFAKTRKSYGAPHFILLSSTAEGRATSGYVVVPEHFEQNGEQAGSNKERTRKKPSLLPEVDFNDALIFLSMQI